MVVTNFMPFPIRSAPRASAPQPTRAVDLGIRGPLLDPRLTLRVSFSRKSGDLRGFRRATDRARRSGQGLTSVVMFLLVPQVKLRKRLDVARVAERWSAQLPALIERQLRSD